MKFSRDKIPVSLRAVYGAPQEGYSFESGPISEATDDSWRGTLSVLPQPMNFSEDIKTLFENDHFRVYPPIKYNIDGVPPGDSRESGKFLLPIKKSPPLELIKNLTVQSYVRPKFEGISEYDSVRIDFASHDKLHRDQIGRFLGLVKCHSGQWWITEQFMSIPLKRFMRFYMLADTRPRPFIRNTEGGYVSAWEEEQLSRPQVGTERPITEELWRRICSDFLDNKQPDTAMNYVHDSIASYLSHKDSLFVVNCAIAMEMLEHRSRKFAGRQETKKHSQYLLKKALVWKQGDREVIRKLFYDRNRIAHGRPSKELLSDRKEERLKEDIDLLVSTALRYYNHHYLPMRQP